MNIAIIDSEVSFPPTSGKRLRTLNLMTRLARRHRITCIARSTPADREAAVTFRDHHIEPVFVEDPVPRKAGLAFYSRLAANLLSPLPYSAVTHVSPALRRAAAQHAARHPVDLWQLEWTAYLDAVPPVSLAPRLMMAPNVDALIWQRYHETERHLLRRAYVGWQWKKLERWEGRMFRAADRCVAVSEEDASLMRQLHQVQHVDVVENGVDVSFYQDVAGKRDPHHILFLGSMDWRPNLDAIQLLLGEIFPAVRRQSPRPDCRSSGAIPPSG